MKPLELNINSLGKIHVMPRKVYWSGIPDSIRDKDKIELLQRDIWTVPYPVEKINDLGSESDLILFINLDVTLLKTKSIVPGEEIIKARKLIAEISQIKPLHTVVHTTHINPMLADLFTKASITYIEKNLYDINAAIQTVIRTVDFIYSKTQRNKREYLRIEIDKTTQLPIKCSLDGDRNAKFLPGIIRDLSLSGLQIGFSSSEFEQRLALKNFIELSFILGPYNIKIQKALITRMDKNTRCIGVHFDLQNEKMVRDLYAAQYTEILYQWIKDIQKKEQEGS